MTKDEMVGKKTSLTDRRALAGTQEGEFCALEQGAENSGGLQGCCEVNAVRKIRRATELNLPKENLNPLLDVLEA